MNTKWVRKRKSWLYYLSCTYTPRCFQSIRKMEGDFFSFVQLFGKCRIFFFFSIKNRNSACKTKSRTVAEYVSATILEQYFMLVIYRTCSSKSVSGSFVLNLILPRCFCSCLFVSSCLLTVSWQICTFFSPGDTLLGVRCKVFPVRAVSLYCWHSAQ